MALAQARHILVSSEEQCIALKNESENIHLVASKLGAPIYKKLGFKCQGYLKSYSI